MDINRDIKLDRRFPQTYGFWWEEYKEPEPVVVTEDTSESEEDIIIKDAYWMDEEGNEIRQLSADYPVTLYVELENFVEGKEIELTFQDEDEEGVKKVDCRGVVNADGFIIIENFKLEFI
ncbi:MAG: hypothetical protein LUE98_05175 [Tannerellaceae bacterium]|nr:hypothetical protein [Tannerellaceae bacterium]